MGPGPADASQTALELRESTPFRALVRSRWTASLALLALLFAGYYGFLLLVATRPGLVARRLSNAPGAVTNLGLVLAIAILGFAWLLTALYVLWANRTYDPEVQRLRRQLRR